MAEKIRTANNSFSERARGNDRTILRFCLRAYRSVSATTRVRSSSTPPQSSCSTSAGTCTSYVSPDGNEIEKVLPAPVDAASSESESTGIGFPLAAAAAAAFTVSSIFSTVTPLRSGATLRSFDLEDFFLAGPIATLLRSGWLWRSCVARR